MIVKGTINQPILNGFIVIKDSGELYSNVIKDINSLIIFDFDYLEIKNLYASSDDSGNIFINGSLPFYSNDEFSESNKYKANNLILRLIILIFWWIQI